MPNKLFYCLSDDWLVRLQSLSLMVVAAAAALSFVAVVVVVD